MLRINGILIGAIIICVLALPLAARADTANLSILFTGDTHGHLRSFYQGGPKPVGGVAKRAIFFQEKRRHVKNMSWITLDSGDALSGTILSDIFKGYADVEAMNQLGYDAMCLGVHDFDYGVDVLRQRISEAKFVVVSANVIDAATSQPFTTPYFILERGGMRIAIVGLTTGSLAEQVAPQNFTGLRVEDPIETIKRLLPEIQAQSDVVIALTHLGVNEDIRLASEVQAIDVIVGGMSESELHLPLRVERTIIVHSGSYGANVGLCKLSFDTATVPWNRKWLDCSLEPMGGKWTENSEYLTWLAGFQEQLDIQMGTVLGTSMARMSCLRVSSSETPLGDYVCDALREKLGTDVAILPAHFFQSDLPEGPVLLSDLYNVLPFPYYAQTLTVTGGELKEILDDAAMQIGQPGFPQVSGVNFTIYYGKTVNLSINGQAVDPFKSYTVATADAEAMARLGYATMAKIDQRTYSGVLIRDIVKAQLQSGQVASASINPSAPRIGFMARDPNALASTPPTTGAPPADTMPQATGETTTGTQPPAGGDTYPAGAGTDTGQPPITPGDETTQPGGGEPPSATSDTPPSEGETPPGTFTQPGAEEQAASTPEAEATEDGMQRFDRNGDPITQPPVVIEDEVLTDTGSDIETGGDGSTATPPSTSTPPETGTLPGASTAQTGIVIGQSQTSQDGIAYLFKLERIDNNYRYTLEVTNSSNEPVTFSFPTGERFDFEVYDGTDFIWNNNHGWFFVQSQQTYTISPGETMEHTADWRRVTNTGTALPPGSYRFNAVFKLQDGPVRLQFDAVLPN